MEKGMVEGMEKGMEKGLKVGMARGMETGQLLAFRDILKAMLHDKFGRLPKKLQKDIDATADVELLRRAIRGVPQCESLADFEL
jgi:hypothetical protein